MTELAFIELGSNIEPERYLPAAIDRLKQLGVLLRVSAAYANPALGPQGQSEFVNAAALLRTELDPPALRRALKSIESELGRPQDDGEYAPRRIDLDLCLYGERILEVGELTLPCPDLLQRAYLAVTLAELAPEQCHPLTGEALAEIAARLRVGANLTLHAPLTETIASRAQLDPSEEA